MKIVNSVYWYVDWSVGSKFGRIDNGGVDSDVYVEVGSGYSEEF